MADTPPLLVIFGATGLTGKPLLRKALEKNLRVRILVRDPSRVEESVKSHANLEIVKGDLTDLEAVKKACEGAKYVVSVAGNKHQSADKLMLNMATAVVEAMKQYNVERFYYQAGAFTPPPGGKLPVKLKVMRGTYSTLFGIRHMLRDNDAVVQMLGGQKEIKWAVCLPGLIGEGERGLLKEGKAGGKVWNSDLAAFGLECVLGGGFDGRAVYPGY